ncbi:MAG: biotin carboxylase N-terminal domain-containing protein [Thermodesulfobacteriota bacterium]
MIRKILIANRGEIAVRVINTCREMGITSVTLYSDADAALPHTFMSDEAFCLGGGSLADTYLHQDRILAIAGQCGADAIHPGYGFLSENPVFCEKVTAAGLIFIGPTPEAMRLMGDKITSKKRMAEAAIPVIPGYNGDIQDGAFLMEQAEAIGFPVLIKATAGGGGKGMRVVHGPLDFPDALDGAKREAQNAFSNDRVLIEKFMPRSRHIEVQVFGDTHGNYLHFFERECSIQRRHQKIIEETPSTALTPEKRAAITGSAVEVARVIRYVGAGTVEFIYDDSGNFYFLEMNTRLQVEHPITEMVTGFDLVRLQIEVAAGHPLPVRQEDIRQTGHAIEARIYAEDPDNEFLPTTGVICEIGSSRMNGVRLDSGFRDGNSVTIKYDPMLAKLIAHGSTRQEARDRLILALDDILFQGVKTNREFLKRVLASAPFADGNTFTSFIAEFEQALKKAAYSSDEIALIIAGFLFDERETPLPAVAAATAQTAWDMVPGFRNV